MAYYPEWDQSGEPGGVFVAPSFLCNAIDSMARGASPLTVWKRYDRRICYRTLQRWKKKGREWKRYKIAKWFLQNRDKIIEMYRSHNYTQKEILDQLNYPYPQTPYPHVFGTIRTMFHAEDRYILNID